MNSQPAPTPEHPQTAATLEIPDGDLETRCRSLEAKVVDQAAQLAAIHKELENFSHSVSHDLKAPLRAIDGFARIIQEQHLNELSPDVRQLFQTIQRNAHRVGQLIQDLVTFHRIGSVPLSKALVNLEETVRSVFQELLARVPERTIHLEVGPLPSAWADPRLVRQVLINLLSNAIKFTRTRPVATIQFHGRTIEGETVYQLSDNGVGFDPEYAQKLFGMFQKIHSSNEYEGNGAGLAIVQRIIHRHGGRVWAESQLEVGTTIGFALPLEAA